MKVLLPLICLCGGMLLGACAQEPEPNLGLPEDTLVRVLEDIHLAESATQDLPVSLRDSILEHYYGRILDEHGVDSTQWEAILAQLRRSPVTLERIYQRVSDSLEVRNITVREQASD